MSLQTTIGTIVSNMVTVEIQLPTFLLVSVTVKVTVLTPKLVQSNQVLDNQTELIKVLSVNEETTWLVSSNIPPELSK